MNAGNQLYDYHDCRNIDKYSIDAGMPELQLMGQAALSSLYRLKYTGRIQCLSTGGRLLMLCGPGNNGGDALALTYMLLGENPEFKKQIRFFRTGESRTETSKFYERQLLSLDVEIEDAEKFLDLEIRTTDIIIEALLGIGQSSAPRGMMAKLLDKIAQCRLEVPCPELIALDVPTGLREDAAVRFVPPGTDTSEVIGTNDIFPAPDEIHSFGVEKLALRLNPDLAAYSEIVILPMGFHPGSLNSKNQTFLMNPSYLDNRLFIKKPTDHKYSSGHSLLIGGSPSMEGAAVLASSSFFASGGGILHTLVPNERSREFLTAAHPSIMFLNMEEFIPDRLLPGAIGIGPGLAHDDFEAIQNRLLDWLFDLQNRYDNAKKSLPWIVIDAGGLDFIRNPSYPDELKKRTICTPHTGEWKKMGGNEITDSRALFEAMEYNQKNLGCWTLVKDSISSLLGPGENMFGAYIYSFPQASLAVAGSGDVLTGILLAALSRKSNQNMGIPGIVQAALHLHGSAGDQEIHPMSENFPSLIRKTLAES